MHYSINLVHPGGFYAQPFRLPLLPHHRKHKHARYRKVKPLTILVTRDIAACKRLIEDLIDFLAEQEGISREEAEKKVLIVTSAQEHQANVRALADVDRPKVIRSSRNDGTE